jgi:hypothetical protein
MDDVEDSDIPETPLLVPAAPTMSAWGLFLSEDSKDAFSQPTTPFENAAILVCLSSYKYAANTFATAKCSCWEWTCVVAGCGAGYRPAGPNAASRNDEQNGY